MEQLFTEAAHFCSLLVEGGSALVIVLGSAQAFYGVVVALFKPEQLANLKGIWRQYATWLLLGLEFALAADVIKTAIAPTWDDIGQLAAIAAIRTFLNYFLQRDIQSGGPLGA
jgi:uncharacterized membrane protein